MVKQDPTKAAQLVKQGYQPQPRTPTLGQDCDSTISPQCILPHPVLDYGPHHRC